MMREAGPARGPSAAALAGSLLAGAMLAFAFPPQGATFAALALAVPFGLAASAATVRQAAWIGAAAGLGFFLLHIAWLPVAFSRLLSPAFWLTFPPMLLLLAAFWAATTAAARAAGGHGRGTLLVLPLAWVATELLRSVGFLGFPWGTLGYLTVATPLAQFADLIGVHGLSLGVAAVAAALAAPFVPSGGPRLAPGRAPRSGQRPAWFPPLLAVALVLAAWFGGEARLRSLAEALPEPDRVALLVQGNVDPLGRALGARAELDVHLDLTQTGVASLGRVPDLVVWPEGAVVGFPFEGFRGEPARNAVQAAAPGATFLVGGRATVAGGSTNSVHLIRDAQLLGRYDKHVLVPFGERWPFLSALEGLYRMVFRALSLPMLENTVPGPGPAALPGPDGAVAAYVCYESVFPRVVHAMVAQGARVLVNVTNDAWFGAGTGAEQHFAMGALRAIETRRWLLRAGNDGITASVDPTGAVRDRLPQGVPGALAVPYALAAEEHRTVIVRYGWLTPWAVLGLLLVSVPLARLRSSLN